MFNGIIFNKGTVAKIEKRKKGINLFLQSSIKLSRKDLGVSISCDGVCLTLISCKKKIIEFYDKFRSIFGQIVANWAKIGKISIFGVS